MAHLITGFAGYEHIQSEDAGSFNAAFFGDGQFVMEIGSQFEGSILNNNTVRIFDGDGLMYGRHFRIKPNTYEDLNIITGTAGVNRVDLIVMTYEKDNNSGTEKVYLEVLKGEEAKTNAVAPSYTIGNILEGAAFNQMPLYRVNIEGVVLASIEQVFVTQPTYKALAEQYEYRFQQACSTHLDSLNILDTMEEIEANTRENQLPGALGVKEFILSIIQSLKITRGILSAGETSITLNDSRITGDSAIIPFTSIAGVNPTSKVATVGSVTLTFDAQASDMEVGVQVYG